MHITKKNKRIGENHMRIRGFLVLIFLLTGVTSSVNAEGNQIIPPKQDWSFKGLFGTYDRAAAQRGYQVYKQVCSACHSMHLLSYRNLGDLGFSKAEVKAIARGYDVPGGVNDAGEPITRPGEPHDHFIKPFPNDEAARSANNGALPPDLSLIIKARPYGPDYVHALLLGYADAPAGFHLVEGMHYNKYFPGHQIGMIPPLKEDIVTYSDGTKATVEQMTTDVVTFLAWAAEPEMEARKRLGVRIFIFLGVFFALMFALYKRTWRSIKK